jgi:hypothetical protein
VLLIHDLDILLAAGHDREVCVRYVDSPKGGDRPLGLYLIVEDCGDSCHVRLQVLM